MIVFLAIFSLTYFLTRSQAQICDTKFGPTGSISYYNAVNKCWNIHVPLNSFIRLNLTILSLNKRSCSYNYVKISVKDSDEEYQFCESSSYINRITALNNVTVSAFTFAPNNWNYVIRFEVQYEILDTECSRKESFRCTKYSCIPRYQVCDGIKHCKNGADEVGCETGVRAIQGVSESLEIAVSWMQRQQTPAWGWREDTPRAVVALFLASDGNVSGIDLETEMIIKQAELRTAVALFRSSLTNNELSMLVHSLLVSCHNPRHFFGKNLVKHLKTQVKNTRKFIHPVAYLALCNANETMPDGAFDNLNNILNSTSDYPFLRDIQAMAVIALSCMADRSLALRNASIASSLFKDTVKRFKSLQLQDGSFGNAHTTALITQALIASGEEHSKDWKLNSTIEFLMKEVNSTSVDFLSMYLILPILNGKTLADIANINCSSNPRKHEEDIISEINDYLGSKIRIKYYLYLGDEKDVIHSISLRVPENFTAYEVMQLAAAEDPKYKFDENRISENVYIYKIANITNDPEEGKFWLQYIRSSNNGTEELEHFSKSPDKLIMKDGQHLIMWYKTADF